MRVLRGLPAVLVAFAVGFAAGVFGSFEHLQTHDVGSHSVPWGLGLAFGVTALAMTATSDLGVPGRLAGAVGWFVAVGLAAARTHAGDLVVTASWQGYSWLIGGTVTVIVTPAWRSYAEARRALTAQEQPPLHVGHRAT